MLIGKWKRSQTSNGYYLRGSSGNLVFVRIERNEFGSTKVWDVMRRDGMQGSPYILRREINLVKAKKWMMSYMKAHPYGW